MKKQQHSILRIEELCQLALLIFILAGLSICSACNSGEEDGPSINLSDLSFELVMEESPYFRAEELSISPNGKYIIASVRSGTSFHYFKSTDGGDSFSTISVSIDRQTIHTNISNDGKFILENSVVNIEDESSTPITQISSNLKHVVTESGKVLSFQGRRNEMKLYEVIDGQLNEIEVDINFNPTFFAGVSGEKIGFIKYQLGMEINVYDADMNTVSTNQVSFSGPFRPNNTVIAYSEGYFALAYERECLIISPTLEITNFPYPDGYNNFMNTSAIDMLGNRIFLPLFKNTGELTVFEIDDEGIKPTDLSSPVLPLSDGFITSGFLENGDRAFSGLIKYDENRNPAYLNGTINESFGELIGQAVEVGDYIYFRNKRYNQLTKTFSSSPFNNPLRVVFLDNGQLVYSENGPQLSIDNGETWTSIETEPFIQPTYVVRDEVGTYYGLVITFEANNVRGETTIIYGHKVYTSSDPTTSWALIPGSEKSNFDRPPQGCSSDGTILVIDNLAPSFGNLESTVGLSKDFGVTYETFNFSDVPPSEKTSQFETKEGKKVVVNFSAGGIMTLQLGRLQSDEFSNTEIMLPVELLSASQYSVTRDDRLLLSGNGVFKSSEL